jgi:hypothetical protein
LPYHHDPAERFKPLAYDFFRILRCPQIQHIANVAAESCYEIAVSLPSPKATQILEALIANFSCPIPIMAPPTGNESVKVRKLCCPNWWFKVLKRSSRQQKELLKLALGLIGAGQQPYASDEAVENYRRKVEFERNFLAQTYIPAESEHKKRLSELKPSDQRRFAEFMTIAKGIETVANSKNLVATLLTLTLPSEYHPNPQNGSLGWEGYTPKEAYKKLVDIFLTSTRGYTIKACTLTMPFNVN